MKKILYSAILFLLLPCIVFGAGYNIMISNQVTDTQTALGNKFGQIFTATEADINKFVWNFQSAGAGDAQVHVCELPVGYTPTPSAFSTANWQCLNNSLILIKDGSLGEVVFGVGQKELVFDPPLDLTVGTRYLVSLQSTVGTGNLYKSSDDSYAGGVMYMATTDYTGEDSWFEVYTSVEPYDLVIPQGFFNFLNTVSTVMMSFLTDVIITYWIWLLGLIVLVGIGWRFRRVVIEILSKLKY